LVKNFGNNSYHVVYSHSMDLDADDKLVLDNRNQGEPLVFKEKATSFLSYSANTRKNLYFTKYEKALIRPTLHSLIAIPIFKDENEVQKPVTERDAPVSVLCIDSDSDLGDEYRDNDFMDWLVKESVVFSSLEID